MLLHILCCLTKCWNELPFFLNKKKFRLWIGLDVKISTEFVGFHNVSNAFQTSLFRLFSFPIWILIKIIILRTSFVIFLLSVFQRHDRWISTRKRSKFQPTEIVVYYFHVPSMNQNFKHFHEKKKIFSVFTCGQYFEIKQALRYL